MKNDFITEISEEDFRRLNLIGYRNTKVQCENNTYKYVMKQVYLNDILDQELHCSKEPVEDVVFAIHVEPTESAIAEAMKMFTSDDKGGSRNFSREEAYFFTLYEYSYLDKFMNRFTGMQTFQYGTNIVSILSLLCRT